MKRVFLQWAGVVCGCWVGLSAEAAVILTEAFETTASGWVDRDAGDMTVSHAGMVGSPAGSLAGTFALQDVPSPQTDAWRANGGSSSGSFVGNYWTGLGGFFGWSFSFYAVDVLPSDLQIRFNGGGPTFFSGLLGQVHSVGSWYTVQAPTTYAGNWFGGSAVQWSNALANVQYVEVQVTRNGTTAQSYYFDNFSNGSSGGDPGPSGSAVPEPGGVGIVLLGAGMLWSARRLRPART